MTPQHDISVQFLLNELYLFFHIKIEEPILAAKKSDSPQLSKDVAKKKPVKFKRYNDIDDTPIDEATMKELQALREDHLKALKASSSVQSSQKKLTN